MKNQFFFVVLLMLCFSFSAKSSGFGDWSAHTKFNNHFYQPGGELVIYLKNGKQYKNPSTWYFYKNHIIGIRKQWMNNKYIDEYFIIDEKENTILELKKRIEWKRYLEKKHLVPFFWTRWCSGNWNHLETLVILSIFCFPLTLLLIMLNLYFFIQAIKINQLNFKGKWTKLSLIFPSFLFCAFILGQFPQSF